MSSAAFYQLHLEVTEYAEFTELWVGACRLIDTHVAREAADRGLSQAGAWEYITRETTVRKSQLASVMHAPDVRPFTRMLALLVLSIKHPNTGDDFIRETLCDEFPLVPVMSVLR